MVSAAGRLVVTPGSFVACEMTCVALEGETETVEVMVMVNAVVSFSMTIVTAVVVVMKT